MAAGFSTGFIITWSTRLKPTLILGYSLMMIGSLLLTFMNKSLPSWAYTQFIVASSMGQGFSYPSVSLSILATSTTEDLAVATNTLILWRSLGTVMGVAISSLIVQNSLLYYLNYYVTGPQKGEVCWLRSHAPRFFRKPSGLTSSVLEDHKSSAQIGRSYLGFTYGLSRSR